MKQQVKCFLIALVFFAGFAGELNAGKPRELRPKMPGFKSAIENKSESALARIMTSENIEMFKSLVVLGGELAYEGVENGVNFLITPLQNRNIQNFVFALGALAAVDMACPGLFGALASGMSFESVGSLVNGSAAVEVANTVASACSDLQALQSHRHDIVIGVVNGASSYDFQALVTKLIPVLQQEGSYEALKELCSCSVVPFSIRVVAENFVRSISLCDVLAVS
jgi:hypothetical protein